MDERRIEELLGEALAPSDEAQERVLRGARQELHARKSTRWALRFVTWKTAFAALGIAVVMLSNISDCTRQQRVVTVLVGGSSALSNPSYIERILKDRREIERMAFAQAPLDGEPANGWEGGRSL